VPDTIVVPVVIMAETRQQTIEKASAKLPEVLGQAFPDEDRRFGAAHDIGIGGIEFDCQGGVGETATVRVCPAWTRPRVIFCPQITIIPVAEARRFTRRSLGLIVV
jgi:hypothetical protein